MLGETGMNEQLKILVEKARQIQMSPAEREEQRRSFAFGNTHFENPLITRELIDREAEKMKRDQDSGPATARK
jgi:hypothetical protein